MSESPKNPRVPRDAETRQADNHLRNVARPGGMIEQLKAHFPLVSVPENGDDMLTDDEILRTHGADALTLASLSIPEQVVRLLDVASMRVRTLHDKHEYAKETARDRLYEMLVRDPHKVSQALFDHLDVESVKTLSFVNVIGALYETLQRDIERLRHSGASPNEYLGEYRRTMFPLADAAERRGKQEVPPTGLYLVNYIMGYFLFHIAHLDERVRPSEGGQPFAFSETEFAMLSSDGDRMYIANAELSRRIARDPQSHESYELMLDQAQPLLPDSVGVSTPEDLDEFVAMFNPTVRAAIEHDLGVNATTVSRHEKFYLFAFLRTVRMQDVEGVQSFVRSFGRDGARTFLAASVDLQVRNEVLSLANSAKTKEQEERVRAVFRAFGKFADHVEKIEELLREKFKVADDGLRRDIEEQLLRRGRDLLARAHDFRDAPEKLAELIRSLDIEVAATGAMIGPFLKRGGKLEEIRGVSMARERGGSIKGELRKQYLKLHRAGYEAHARENDAYVSLLPLLHDSLEKRMGDPDTEFVNLVDERGALLAGLRFDHEYDDAGGQKALQRIHLASVTSNAHLGKSGAGAFHTERAVREKSLRSGAPIYAECDRAAGITKKYLEWGLVALHATKVDALETYVIEMDVRRNERLESLADKGNISDDDIRRRAGGAAVAPGSDGSVRIRYWKGSNPPALQDFPPGHVMTRLLKNGQEWFAVFEKDPLVR